MERKRWLLGGLMTWFGLVIGHDAGAVILTVGNEAACTHGTVQGAINALPTGGVHEIRIKTNTYTAQAIKIQSRVLTLRGGYASCTQTSPSGSSTLSGNGGDYDSVITITGDNNDIKLENLLITGGDETPNSHGGGVDFKGSGKLSTRNVTISNNYAGYGGGISFIAEGDTHSELNLLEDTQILWNTAQFSGGGIRLEGYMTMRAASDRIWISGNQALGRNPVNNAEQYGYGGGLLILDRAHAHISSPGFLAAAAITNNSARYGGGVAVMGAGEGSLRGTTLYLYGTDAARPARIEYNQATQTGGGVYVETSDTLAQLCAWEFGINHNTAQNGSAVYLDVDHSFAGFNSQNPSSIEPCYGSQPPGIVACTPGVNGCNTIAGNRNEDENGTPTDGATILVQDYGWMNVNRVIFRDNIAGNIVRAFTEYSDSLTIYNSLFTGNQTIGALLRNSGPERFRFENSTIVGNTIGSQVFLSTGDITIGRSIIWQPGVTVLSQSGGSRSVSNVMAHEVASIGAAIYTVWRVANPYFLDPDRGDYRPHAGSLAVDFASTGGGVDLMGNPRATDLAEVLNVYGSADLGAYERMTIDPLVRNGDFDGDLRYWGGNASVTYDNSVNQSGPAGASGVMKISGAVAQGGRITATHCIPLPGPGTYYLSAWGRGAGIGVGADRAVVGWRLIPVDVFDRNCTGDATKTGEVVASFSNNWNQMSPIAIELSEGEADGWSSLQILLSAVDSGIAPGPSGANATAYFDGVRLVFGPAGDALFSDGFED